MQQKKRNIGLIIGLAVGIPLSILLTVIIIILLIPDDFLDGQNQNGSRIDQIRDDIDGAGGGMDGGNVSAGTNANGSLGNGVKTDETWAVYWYLCGTDLESEEGLATMNIGDAFEGAELGEYPENVTFVIEAGGCERWHNGNFSSDCLTRMVSHGQDYEVVERPDSANMGESDTFADFLKFCNDNYPADHKMVLFWNHGGGTLEGACNDELYDWDALELDEMYEAFANTCTLSPDNPPYDIVGFDCCLMSTLDVANVLSDVAKYMVASEESEPGNGWDYYTWAGTLSDNPKISPEEFGRIICESYINLCNECEPENNATLALLDLSRIQPVLDAYDAVGLSAIKLTTKDNYFYTDFARTVGITKGFGDDSEWSEPTYLVDLGDFADKIKGRVPEAADLRAALDNMVIYNALGPRAGNATGLSFCYTAGADEEDIRKFLQLGAGSSFKYFYSLGMAEDMTEEGKTYLADNGIADNDIPKIDTLASLGVDEVPLSFDEERGLYYVDIGSDTASIVSSVKYGMYSIDEDYDELIFLGYDDEIECDWENGRFYDGISGNWGFLENIPVFMNLVYSSDSYNEYSVDIDVDGEDAVLKVYYDFDREQWTIGNAYYVSEDGIPTKNTLQLEEGMEIGVVCYASTITGDDDLEAYIMDTFTYHKNIVFDTAPLPDGEYALQFEMSDVIGNTVYSDFLFFWFEDGEIYYDM